MGIICTKYIFSAYYFRSMLIEDFKNEQNNKVSAETLQAYMYDLQSYLDFLSQRYGFNENDSLDEVIKKTHEADIVIYLQYCKSELHNTTATVNRKISSLRKFYKYLNNRKILQFNIALNVSHEKKIQSEKDILTPEECRALFECVNGKNKYRDLGILMMFFFCGATVNDVCDIKYDDFDGEYIYLKKKDKISRKLLLNDALRCVLSRLNNKERVAGQENLFCSRGGTGINKRTVHQITVKYFTKAGLYEKGMTGEILRKTGLQFIKEYAYVDSGDAKLFFGYNTDYVRNGIFDSDACVDLNALNKIPLAKMKVE